MDSENLVDTVIKNDYCVGCGACAAVNPDYEIKKDQFGMFKANYIGRLSGFDDLALKVCPFSNYSKNEDTLADELYPEVTTKHTYLGKYIQNYVGNVKEGEFRTKGSSGGFAKWILNELLKHNHVDYVIQVVPNNERDNIYTFEVFKTGDDILSGSKSAYYPVTMVEMFDFIKNNNGRYAVTAVPCFSKAIRNVCAVDQDIRERVKFVIGIICGHLKSTGFAESLGWQLNVNPRNLRGLEFRGKIPGLPANEKGVYAIDEMGNQSKVSSSRSLLGGNWGYGFFKYKSCDYCDDIVGETADVSVGDAWLKDLMDDHHGNSVVIVRNALIGELIQKAIEEDRIAVEMVDPMVVVKSQDAGIRHRREGLSYRLNEKKANREWVPAKRVAPSSNIHPGRKIVYRLREHVRDLSHQVFYEAKERNDLSYFMNKMTKEVEKFHKLTKLGGVILKFKIKVFELKKKLS